MQNKIINFLNLNNQKKKNINDVNENKMNGNNDILLVEKEMQNNKDVQIIDNKPKTNTTNNNVLSFQEKVELEAEDMKNEILRMHSEGNTMRFIGNEIGISRELVRLVLNGTGSLKIVARQRVATKERVSRF